MANDFFAFKQFTVRQANCAMKVCTDSCILGGYAASLIRSASQKPDSILDIGSGTGLLSLMMAQVSGAEIDAIEIDAAASHQSRQNFSESPWHDRLRIFNEDVRTWKSQKKYDLIISNPPFFENDLKGNNASKTMAMHDEGLLLAELASILGERLSQQGSFMVMIPYHRLTFLQQELTRHGLTTQEILNIRHKDDRPLFRSIVTGRKITHPTAEIERKEMAIRDGENYSDTFVQLMKPYYLYL